MKKTVDGLWTVEASVQLEELTIGAGGVLAAPEGKYLTLTVNGVTMSPGPGTYTGDVRITVAEDFVRSTMRFGEETISHFRTGVVVDNGKVVSESSVPAAVQGGSVTDRSARGVRIESREWDFNGFYITGDSEYEISDAQIEMTGDGTDDFVGMGASIAATGTARVTVSNTKISNKGIGRGTLYVGGDSVVTMNDCELHACADEPTPEELEAGNAQGRMMSPPWSIGLRGHVRTLNLAGNGQLTLNRCHCTSDRWGVLSIDGACVNRLTVNDSLIEITGDNGYGCFCICDDILFDYDAFDEPGCIDIIDHSVFNVAYTAVLMSLGSGCAQIRNKSEINSRRFGVFCHRHNGGWLKIDSGAEVRSEASSIVVKGSNLHIELDNAVLLPKNGTILQLMDNDDVGMCDDPFLIPIGEKDVRDERDLTKADPIEDVFVTIRNMETTGNFLNSTTNFRACNRRLPKADDAVPAPAPPGSDKLRGFTGAALMGAKNLDVKIENATVNGVISSAEAYYQDGLTQITAENCEELSNITQIPAPAVNNGVIVSVGTGGVWNVTGTSYLTKLEISGDGAVIGNHGAQVVMTVDGMRMPLAAGCYIGQIVLQLL